MALDKALVNPKEYQRLCVEYERLIPEELYANSGVSDRNSSIENWLNNLI